MNMQKSSYEKCELCARKCKVNRSANELGYCGANDKMKIARAALHFWEEPPISGTRGSGAVFFSGCSLSCIFCQNHKISRGEIGMEISDKRLAEIMLSLQKKGAHNINLVTPTHFAPSIISSVRLSRVLGLKVPIVYNTSSYDTVQTIKLLRGTVDIYLADFKYFKDESAIKYSNAQAYFKTALAALDEMVLQCGDAEFQGELMKRGVIIRILELPSHVAEAKLILSKLYQRYSDKVYFSLMNQYTPMNNPPPPLNRTITREEYRSLVEYAERLGIKNAFYQDFGAASEDFIPEFDYTGLK